MIIQEKDFRLIPTDAYSNRFDVELLYIVKPKTGEPHEEFKNIAYSVSLEYAMRLIINYRTNKKLKDASITMKQYLYVWITELKYIKDIVKTCVSGNDSILDGLLTDSVKNLTITSTSTQEDVVL